MAQKYFLVLYICYLPVYLALLFYLKSRFQGYSMRAHMVSYLAASGEPWRSVFNVATIVYGGLSFVVPLSLNALPGTDRLVALGAASLLAAGASTILVGCFPMDRRLRVHNVLGCFAFVSVLLTGIVFSAIFYRGILFSPLMELVNLAVLGTTVLLGLSLLLRRQESSFLEWLAMIFTIGWNFLMAVLLFGQMYLGG
jgi:hypothetical protein